MLPAREPAQKRGGLDQRRLLFLVERRHHRKRRRGGVLVRAAAAAVVAGLPLRQRLRERLLEALDPFAALRSKRLDFPVGHAGRRLEQIACEVERAARRLEQARRELATAIPQQRLRLFRAWRALGGRIGHRRCFGSGDRIGHGERVKGILTAAAPRRARRRRRLPYDVLVYDRSNASDVHDSSRQRGPEAATLEAGGAS